MTFQERSCAGWVVANKYQKNIIWLTEKLDSRFYIERVVSNELLVVRLVRFIYSIKQYFCSFDFKKNNFSLSECELTDKNANILKKFFC